MFYRVDGNGRILEVHTRWDEFACANGGGERASSAGVVGRPLLDFVAGDATRMFVSAALDAARHLGSTRVLPYRCDSPTERREFQMVIRPEAGGSVCVEHVLTASEPRPARLNRNRGLGWRCSQCLAVRLAGSAEWRSADTEAGGILAKDVCPSCAVRLFDLSNLATGAEHGD